MKSESKKSVYDYKLGEIYKGSTFKGLLNSPIKLVKIGYTFQDKYGSQVECALKHKDFVDIEEAEE